MSSHAHTRAHNTRTYTHTTRAHTHTHISCHSNFSMHVLLLLSLLFIHHTTNTKKTTPFKLFKNKPSRLDIVSGHPRHVPAQQKRFVIAVNIFTPFNLFNARITAVTIIHSPHHQHKKDNTIQTFQKQTVTWEFCRCCAGVKTC